MCRWVLLGPLTHAHFPLLLYVSRWATWVANHLALIPRLVPVDSGSMVAPPPTWSKCVREAMEASVQRELAGCTAWVPLGKKRECNWSELPHPWWPHRVRYSSVVKYEITNNSVVGCPPGTEVWYSSTLILLKICILHCLVLLNSSKKLFICLIPQTG